MNDEELTQEDVDSALESMRRRSYVLPDPDAGLVYGLSALGNALKRRDEILLDLQQQNEALLADQSKLRAELARKSSLLDEAMAILHGEDEPEEPEAEPEKADVSANGSGDADVRF